MQVSLSLTTAALVPGREVQFDWTSDSFYFPKWRVMHWVSFYETRHVKTRLHGSPRLIDAVESTKLNSTVERYCLHSSTKVNEAVDFKMAANVLVREVVAVMCDCLVRECQKNNKKDIRGKNGVLLVLHREQVLTCLLIRVMW
jgi:hypothetical protein